MNDLNVRQFRDGGRVIHVIQGSFDASSDPNDVMTTLLGSCVCTCLWDPVSGVGGMNHFLLPSAGGVDAGQLRYGLHSMELLINSLLKLGAERMRLQAKLFGGAAMHDGLGNIGKSNSEFALSFLANEGIQCIGQSLGGTQARRVRFWPTTGKAQQLLLNQEVHAMMPPLEKARSKSESDDVVFF